MRSGALLDADIAEIVETRDLHDQVELCGPRGELSTASQGPWRPNQGSSNNCSGSLTSTAKGRVPISTLSTAHGAEPFDGLIRMWYPSCSEFKTLNASALRLDRVNS